MLPKSIAVHPKQDTHRRSDVLPRKKMRSMFVKAEDSALRDLGNRKKGPSGSSYSFLFRTPLSRSHGRREAALLHASELGIQLAYYIVRALDNPKLIPFRVALQKGWHLVLGRNLNLIWDKYRIQLLESPLILNRSTPRLLRQILPEV